jgi:hypothetical protein
MVVILIVALAMIVNNPQALAEGDQIRLQAQRADKAAAIQQQFDQARADVMAPGLAKMELDRQVSAQELKRQGDLKQLDVWYSQQIANIQASTNERWAWMLGAIILILGVAIALVRISGAAAKKAGQWATEIKPNANGQFSMYLTPAGLLAPGRLPGSHMLIHNPSVWEKIAYAIAFLVAVKRGEKTDVPAPSPWVRVPNATEQELRIVTQDQAVGLMVAATRPGAPKEIRAATVRGAMAAFGPRESRMPEITIIEDPVEGDRLQQLMEGRP